MSVPQSVLNHYYQLARSGFYGTEIQQLTDQPGVSPEQIYRELLEMERQAWKAILPMFQSFNKLGWN